jgi:NADPH:quinone reductase-like Zn-dependent oxidoreductase
VTAQKLTSGSGVDAILDVGGPATLEQSIRAARVGGHIALIGVLGGFSIELPIMPILSKQVHLHGVMVGSRRQQQDMVRAINANGMHPILDRQFDLEEIVPAFKYQETNQHFGKIVLNI